MRSFALPLALCVALAAGCGGGDDGDEGGRTVTVKANADVRLVGREYSFDPETIVVRGAGPLTITLRNAGSLAHNARLFRDGEDVGGTPTFPGGRTDSGRVNLEHGSYELICTVGDHAELGMTGTVRVR